MTTGGDVIVDIDYVKSNLRHKGVDIIDARTPNFYTGETPGREAVVWYCSRCDNIVDWRSIDTGQEIPQEAYWEATRAFNDDEVRRTCRPCGAVHPPVELGDIGWLAVALLSLEINALDQKQPMIGDPAPAFSLKTVDGKVVSLEQQRGKFVVLHFAASW